MSVPLITNFTINTTAPIDSRIVATNSSIRDSISYKYDGMQVFTLDDRFMWTYNASASSWTSSNLVDGNGIYTGSGSLVSNTYINTGNIGNTLLANSNSLILSATASYNTIYYSHIYNRHTITGDYTGVEVKNQYSYDGNTSSIAYISFNPYDPAGSSVGNIDFATSNTRRMTIGSNGVLRLWSPTYSASIMAPISNNRTYALPDKSGTFSMISDLTATQSWINITTGMVNANWTLGSNINAFCVDRGGRLQMKGYVTTNAAHTSAATPVITLPSGYWPLQTTYIICYGYVSGTGVSTYYMEVETNGAIRFPQTGGAWIPTTAGDILILDQISFYIN